MFELKLLSREGIPGALAKAERYRLLNQPWEAECIYRDVIEVEPENQEAVIGLVLAITDQFEQGSAAAIVPRAREALLGLRDEYQHAYYAGIICERRARVLLQSARPGSGAMAHELLHVRRRDWAVQIAADLVRRAYWFQPLMWIACRMLRRESEQACDDVVLGAGVEAPAYAGHLLHLARAGRTSYRWAVALPMARPSTLERRITAMLNSARNRRALTFRAVVVTTIALAAASFTAAAFHAEQAQSAQLTGTIYDGSGAVLPGVAVTLTDAQNAKAEATTDASGRPGTDPAGHARCPR